MKRMPIVGLLALATVSALSFFHEVSAGEREYRRDRGTQVRGYSERRGGYSYTYQDTINTYGNPQYGHNNVYRDPAIEQRLQSPAGPFDHGFFFDSGITRNGGNSPYLN
jgi:hypothetical protein